LNTTTVLRLVTDNTSDIVLLTDENSIIYANEQAINHLGYSLLELSSMNYYSLITEEDRERVEELAMLIIENNQKSINFQSWLLRKNRRKKDNCDV